MALSKRTKEREVSLVMHYMDHVWHRQFPFHCTAYVGHREWLLSMLTSTRSTFYATLSLALLYKGVLLEGLNSDAALKLQEDKTRYYTLAIQETQQVLCQSNAIARRHDTETSIQLLIGAIQLANFEASPLVRGHWELHLHAGASLIPGLAESWAALAGSCKPVDSLWCQLDASGFESSFDSEALSFEQVCALKFYVNALLALGVLSCISVGANSCFAEYQLLLADRSGLIQMEQLMGCRNWVMSVILEIAILDQWKSEELQSHRLSIKELNRRAVMLEEKLAGGLRGTPTMTVPDIITKIYASAALTYLHSVVSGLNPFLTEIQETVANTIVLFKQLHDLDPTVKLVWPLCVTGCMALPNREHTLTALMDTWAVKNEPMSNVQHVRGIIEEVWRVRGQLGERGITKWEDLINRDGFRALLI